MWAVFCTLNQHGLPAGWRKVARVLGVTLARQDPAAPGAEAPGDAPGDALGDAPCAAAPGDVPACPCCYYNRSQDVGATLQAGPVAGSGWSPSTPGCGGMGMPLMPLMHTAAPEKIQQPDHLEIIV